MPVISSCPCTPTQPAFPALLCDREQKSAGIDTLFLLHCSVNFNDLTDVTEWQTLIQSGNVTPIRHVKVTRPAPNVTNFTDSTGADVPSGVIFQLDIEDRDIPYDPNTASPAVDSRKHDTWDYFNRNAKSYLVGWHHPNGDVYGFYPMLSCSVFEQSPETQNESRMFAGSIMFRPNGQILTQPKPVAVDLPLALLG